MSEQEMLSHPPRAILKAIFYAIALGLALGGGAILAAAFIYIVGYWVIGGQIAIWLGVF